jgi:hypothetical protein
MFKIKCKACRLEVRESLREVDGVPQFALSTKPLMLRWLKRGAWKCGMTIPTP